MLYQVSVVVMPRKGILDPQGQAVKQALEVLGYQGIDEVKIGKHMELILEATDKKTLEIMLEEMCKKLLANTVVEDYHYFISEL